MVRVFPSRQSHALLTRETIVLDSVPHAVRNDGIGGVSDATTVVASHDEQRLEALEEYREFRTARRQLSALHAAVTAGKRRLAATTAASIIRNRPILPGVSWTTGVGAKRSQAQPKAWLSAKATPFMPPLIDILF